ncbi:GAF domain-containing protein [Streptomyces sp. NBC_01696]|uniref:GAF domain-containing protein n=1 Tax=unclassified Streptomyces TaxID=2593676 RepID=UPI000F555E7E|nr:MULTISPECIES: GAF domain-containing protein [unclassified Streptomyces]RPK47448.1 Acetoin dehydrogenase operon transcriptional activator AcoR [Streptomyces sp. ADI93-02]
MHTQPAARPRPSSTSSPAVAAGLVHRAREARLAGERTAVAPRAEIDASWDRVLRSGVDPEQSPESRLLETDEIEHRRRSSALGEVMPLLREGLATIADAAQQIMVVTDTEGRVLWRQGHAAVMRRAKDICLEEGAAWTEAATGTNAIGTALAARTPIQVHSAEHFIRALHSWTCAAAPVRDPRDGRLMGIVDISGPASTFHPATLALVGSVAALAESELRSRHLVAIERLRSVAAPLLCRLGGRALVVDTHGWLAAVSGMPPVDRLPLPKSLEPGTVWLASLGMCRVEPLPGGWLVQVAEGAHERPPRRVVLDLSRERELVVHVAGPVGSWSRRVSPRHAELLYALALYREGRSAAELAEDVFGDASRTVTVRAEISRMRRHLAEVLAHRPYRFREGVEVEVVHPGVPADLLPRSTAPVVLRARMPAGAV